MQNIALPKTQTRVKTNILSIEEMRCLMVDGLVFVACRDQSLKLARTLAPEQIPFISRAYAQQLEFKGEHSLALQVRRNDSMPLCRMPTGRSTLALLEGRSFEPKTSC